MCMYLCMHGCFGGCRHTMSCVHTQTRTYTHSNTSTQPTAPLTHHDACCSTRVNRAGHRRVCRSYQPRLDRAERVRYAGYLQHRSKMNSRCAMVIVPSSHQIKFSEIRSKRLRVLFHQTIDISRLLEFCLTSKKSRSPLWLSMTSTGCLHFFHRSSPIPLAPIGPRLRT